MKITDALLGEHGVFYAQFEELRRAVEENPDTSKWKAYVALLASGLETHADIEDRVLFTALEASLPAESGPIAVMRSEHEEIRATLARVLKGTDPEAMRADIQHFLEVVHSHFAKEEQVLFPLAVQMDRDGLLERLGEQYAVTRGIALG